MVSSVLFQQFFADQGISECFYGTQWLRIAQSKGSARLGASLPEDGRGAGFQNMMFFLFKKFGTSQKKDGISG